MILSRRILWSLLAFALIIRLITLAAYPLMDTTEARYGEMARLMVETGNWLTPQFDYNVPFWGKPPLFAWTSAAGIKLFGVSEFAVRMPHWLAGVLTIALVAFFAARKGINPLIPSIVMASCAIFAIAAGAVMTDMVLTFSITLSITGFYLCWANQTPRGRLWGYAGFIGVALGLLAKGPVAIVIFALAVVPWLILQHGFFAAFTELWRRFPLVKGFALTLAIALPWYILAEQATPGFLEYFIVGEHFMRFTVSGWEGDLYGTAHDRPRGTIWIYWLISSAPWSFILPFLLLKRRALAKTMAEDRPGLLSLLLLWMISPLVLFSLAGNILPAYVLPGVPALAMLIAILLKDGDEKWFKPVALIIPVVLIGATFYLNLGKAESRSDRVLFDDIDKTIPAYYMGHRPFSGQFYSSGKAKPLTENSQITTQSFYLIGKEKEVIAQVANNGFNCNKELAAKSGRTRFLCTR